VVAARSLIVLRYVTGLQINAWRAGCPGQARADMTEVAGYWSAGRLRTAVHATSRSVSRSLAIAQYPARQATSECRVSRRAATAAAGPTMSLRSSRAAC
jgi:hypothetical protein